MARGTGGTAEEERLQTGSGQTGNWYFERKMKRSFWASVVVGVALIFQVGQALAAGSVEQLIAAGARIVADPKTGITRFVGFDTPALVNLPANLAPLRMPAEAAAAQHLSNYAELFGLRDSASETRTIKHRVGENGRLMTRFQQHYKGIPVIAGELIVNQTALRQLTSIGGKISPDLGLDTTLVIPAEQAQDIARQAMAKWYQLPEEEFLVPAPELSIYDSRLISPHADPIALVWRMDVPTKGLRPINEFIVVDAKTGVISLHFNQVPYAKNRLTYDGNNTTALPGTLVCNESNHTCSGGIQDAVFAHVYAGKTYDFYATNFGRDGIDNAGMTIISTVRHCETGYPCPYANAFWDGSQMAYGQGYSVAEDVVAHELTHGITSRESNLFYYYQSGAINESFSDIFGELVQQSDPSGTVTPATKWLLGEDLSIGAIRSMKNPTSYNNPDKMTSGFYNLTGTDNGGVHTNSGIGNKSAYLMADGDTFNGKTVVGLGLTKVAKIFYEVNSNLLISGSDYLDLYNALYQACQNLVGTAGIVADDCQQVRNATDAVEMNLQPAAGYNPDTSVCPVGQAANNVFFDGFESGSTNWTFVGTPSKWFADAGLAVSGGPFAKTGSKALFGRGDLSYLIDASAQMVNPIAIPTNASLRFDHAFHFNDASYDGGIVEYSIGASGVWTQLPNLVDGKGYYGVISSSYGNPLGGKSAFSGISHGYVSTRFDLSSLAGQSVKFRWRLGTDNSVVSSGWWIDNLQVYTCTSLTYTVTYSGNGNTGGTVPIDGNAYAAGATVTVLGNTGTLVKTGYNFAGWNTQVDGLGTSYAGGATFVMGSGNTTLYAKWTIDGTAPKAITAFNFNALNPVVIGVVNEGAKTVALTVPYGTNPNGLVPTITHTGASVNPASGAAQNFTNPVTYTVTAANSTTQAYTVTVTQLGRVVIDALPDALNATAPWTLTGPNSYSQTGTWDLTLNNLAAGNYTITWRAVSGWEKPSPPSETKAVTNGGTTTFSGTYVQQTISPGCSGDVVVLQNMIFTTGNTYNCTATTSITAATGVTVQSGATVNFRAPRINLQPGFRIESGAVFSAKQ
jgi:bacillolysin